MPELCMTTAATEGRGDCEIKAIVLHEYEGPISQLNAELKYCSNKAKPSCKKSYHYGVGASSTSLYVGIDHQSWTYLEADPDADPPVDGPDDPDCQPCAPLRDVDADNPANCWTVNIAVATGITSSNVSGDSQMKLLAQTIADVLAQLEEAGTTLTFADVYRNCDDLCDLCMDTLEALVAECQAEDEVTPPVDPDIKAQILACLEDLGITTEGCIDLGNGPTDPPDGGESGAEGN